MLRGLTVSATVAMPQLLGMSGIWYLNVFFGTFEAGLC